MDIPQEKDFKVSYCQKVNSNSYTPAKFSTIVRKITNDESIKDTIKQIRSEEDHDKRNELKKKCLPN